MDETGVSNGKRTTKIKADDVIVVENPLYEEFKTSKMWIWKNTITTVIMNWPILDKPKQICFLVSFTDYTV